MNSKNIKVVDEHNIDREANIIFGFDLEGSEYVSYWIERDEDSNNVFVSKIIKNLDNTFNLANIEEEFEKENVSKIVKDLITKSVSDQADKLVGDSITLESGKTVKFITVSFNKEQRLDVKKTYITTVKKEVTKVSEEYYDVLVSLEEPQLVSEVSESTQNIFTDEILSPVKMVEDKALVEPVVPVIPVPEIVSEPVVDLELPKSEPANDQLVSSSVEEKVVDSMAIPEEASPVEIISSVVESITNQPVITTPVVEVKDEMPVLEPSVSEKNDVTELLTQPVHQEINEFNAESTVQSPVTIDPVIPAAVVPEPIVVPETPVVIEPIAQSVEETQPLVFSASKETNLNAALGEVAKDTAISVENIDVVREFGVEEPAMSFSFPDSTEQTIAPMVQPELSSEPKILTKKAGFANSKFFMVVAVAFFLASCVFLGYEVFNYFQITK